MITITDVNRFNNTLEINGLSTDTKPIETIEYKNSTYRIINGSTLYEMDSKKVYTYDEENHQWRDA